jgi:hypothetical protein
MFLAASVVLAFILTYPMVSEAVSGQRYFGDGATPGPAGGWSYTNAGDSACFVCHKLGGVLPAPDKTGYLMTGHKNLLRKATVFSFWSGPDGLEHTGTDIARHLYHASSFAWWFMLVIGVSGSIRLPIRWRLMDIWQ